MKKKLFGCAIFLGLGLALASCSPKEEPKPADTKEQGENKEQGSTNKDTYTIKVVDVDGSVVEKTLDIEQYPTLVKGLTENFTVVTSGEGDSLFVNSIKGAVKDSSWALMLYENGELSRVGVSSVKVAKNDVFEFRNECWNTVESGWGTLDSYDVLIDKAIYSYAKNVLHKKISAYSNIDYIPYELLGINLMKENGYDEDLFNVNDLSQAYKDVITNYNVSTLSGTSFGKWYYGARAINADLTQFKEVYAAYLDTITTYGEGDEYSLPFIISYAKNLGLDSHVLEKVKHPEYIASTQYGVEGPSWELVGQTAFADQESIEGNLTAVSGLLNKAALDNSFNKDVAIGSMLMAYAATNLNPRDVDFVESKDLIEYLFDTYYDTEAMKFNIEKNESDFSSCQIYAGLMAYKIQRDKKKAVNIFA